MSDRIEKTDAEWRSQLTQEQYRITRQKGTERAFSSAMCSLFEPGLYACVCCDTLLFDAREKFESGTGWPSCTQPVKENAIAYQHLVEGVRPDITLYNGQGLILGNRLFDPRKTKWRDSKQILKKLLDETDRPFYLSYKSFPCFG